MLRDLRFGLRMLRKQRGFALVVALTLALGIGATSAVFSLIQGVLLTPPPYAQPDELVLIPSERTDGLQTSRQRGWAAAQWLAWQEQADSFEAIAAYMWTFNFLILPEGSESLEGMRVTQDYFRALGLEPALGRGFLDSEVQAVSPTAIILGHEAWQRTFDGDPGIIGKTVRISRWETAPTVVGVMPPGVRFLPSPSNAQEPNYNVNAAVDFWVPTSLPADRLKAPAWDVFGRLRGGVTPDQAQAELVTITARQAEDEDDFKGVAPVVRSLTATMDRDGRRILLPLFGAAALVLLIACANAAALLLLRGLQRQQEYAVRSALGVSKIALFRQASAESLLLALFGGGLGAALGFGIIRLFQLIGGHAIPRLDAVTMGWPVLAWALVSAVLAAFLAGVFPALRTIASDPMQALKSAGPKSSAGRGERRLLRAVTMVQTALTLVLLVGAGLLIRTMMNLSNVEAGFETGRILTMSVTALEGSWADFHRRALERVSQLPGVEHAAFAWGVPLTGNNWPANLEIEGQPAVSRASDQIALPLRSVTPGYFELLGMSILEGRDLRASDTRDASGVAVVNEAFVDRYFPGSQAVGKKLWSRGRDQPHTEIVGVVSNGRTEDLTREATPEVYLSLWQAGAFSKHLVIRTAGSPTALGSAIQRELRAVEPTAAVENVKALDEIRGDSLADRTFAMRLLIGFAAAAGALTLVGVYSVLALAVASRRREIAIRAAVGAQRGDIRNLVFAEGFRLVAGGVLMGVAAALAISRVLRSFLFEIEPTDPVTLGGATLVFAVVALLACWAPARRAVRVEPIEALRAE